MEKTIIFAQIPQQGSLLQRFLRPTHWGKLELKGVSLVRAVLFLLQVYTNLGLCPLELPLDEKNMRKKHVLWIQRRAFEATQKGPF